MVSVTLRIPVLNKAQSDIANDSVLSIWLVGTSLRDHDVSLVIYTTSHSTYSRVGDHIQLFGMARWLRVRILDNVGALECGSIPDPATTPG